MGTVAMRQDVAPSRISQLVSALGTDEFEGVTLRFLQDLSGIDHYCIYRMRGKMPEFLGGASAHGRHAVRRGKSGQPCERSYAELHHAATESTVRESRAMVMRDRRNFDDPVLYSALEHFNVVDRVLICGRACNDLYAVTLLRDEGSGTFADDDFESIAATGELLINACAKHASIHWDRPRGIKNFESVDVIENKIREADWGISVRELQVCARILFGISTAGSAIDLGLGEETIATYRKRLYARLKIGSRHELFQKYVSLF